jgi:hypothetical protein
MRQAMLGLIFVTSVGASGAAQAPAGTPAAPKKHPVHATYEFTKKAVIAAAEAMPAEQYGVRANNEARSFADLVAHSVSTNFGVCAGARKETNPKAGQRFEGEITSKSELVDLLKASFEYCDVPFAAATGETGTDLTFAISHNNRMLGSMELYLRMQGLAIDGSEINKPAPKK